MRSIPGCQRLRPLDAFIINLLDPDRNEVEGYIVDMRQRLPNTRVPLGQGERCVIASAEPV
jgi:hypothetical protein